MITHGYAGVSTVDQDLAIQHATLKAAGCRVIRAEHASGIRRDGCIELQALLDFVQPGDALVVTRIDRPRLGAAQASSSTRRGPSKIEIAASDERLRLRRVASPE